MATPNNNRVLWILIALLFVGGFVLGRRTAPDPPPLPQLPPEIVRVEVVKEIEVPVEVRVDVPGPTKVVEKVVWRTKTEYVPKEVIREVIKVVEVAAKTGDLDAWIEIQAYKYEGQNQDTGKYEFGWRGFASCSMESGIRNVVLTEQDFDLTQSVAEGTYRPEGRRRPWTVDLRLGATTMPGVEVGLSWHRGSRWGLFTTYQHDLDETEYTIFGENIEAYEYYNLDRNRFSAGVSFRFGRRHR